MFYNEISIPMQLFQSVILCLQKQQNDIKTAIVLIIYYKHHWKIRVDLKMVNFLFGQRRWFTTYTCFISMWDCWARDKHWNQKEWPFREPQEVGMPIIVNHPILSQEKIIIPHLHIKLDLREEFVKALNTDGEWFQHIVPLPMALSFEKIYAGVFDGP